MNSGELRFPLRHLADELWTAKAAGNVWGIK
jgi:hypothetical protein